MPTGPRPYGRGPYGSGPYSRYGPAVYQMAGTTGIVFDAQAAPVSVMLAHAASGITFDAAAQGMDLIIRPQAVTEIVFTTQADLAWSWAGWQPCELGTWAPAAPCETGVWQTPPGCGSGTWTETRLV
jgi:hypothetical protein